MFIYLHPVIALTAYNDVHEALLVKIKTRPRDLCNKTKTRRIRSCHRSEMCIAEVPTPSLPKYCPSTVLA